MTGSHCDLDESLDLSPDYHRRPWARASSSVPSATRTIPSSPTSSARPCRGTA